MNYIKAEAGIQLRSFCAGDKAVIEKWPSYPVEFEELDYALRKEGWFEEFRDRQDTWFYAVEQSGETSGELIAFTILAWTAPGEAEFRIALRSDKAGHGLGRIITNTTLKIGFHEIGLERIHLIVRKNNSRAIELYRKENFSCCGECRKTVNNKQAEFIMMSILKSDFLRG
jgi:diamine N-acetyltransferase